MSDVTLHLGDCLDILPTLAAGSVDAVVTDPPYGVSHRRGKTGNRGYGIGKHVEQPIIGDDTPFDPTPFLSYPVVVLFGANHFAESLPPGGGWTFWHKRPGMAEADFGDGEFIWSNQRHPTRYIRHMWNGVLRDSEVGQEVVHPTQKPVALLQRLLERYTSPGDIVFDPYMGSGPCGVACVLMGRDYIGCEIDPGYFAIAQRRIAAAQAQLVMPLFP